MDPYSSERAFVVRVQSVEDPAPNGAPWYVGTAQEVVGSDLEAVRVLGREGMSGDEGRTPYYAANGALAEIMPVPDEDDAPAPELAPAELWLVCVINFGHDEYPPPAAGGRLRWETLWNPHADEHEPVWDRLDEGNDVVDAELQKRARAAGVMLDDAEVGFCIVHRLMGTREAHENALRELLGALDGLSHTSDDDFYDYWPSGVRAAQAWARVLGGPWPEIVEDRVRAILSDEELTTLREHEGKV